MAKKDQKTEANKAEDQEKHTDPKDLATSPDALAQEQVAQGRMSKDEAQKARDDGRWQDVGSAKFHDGVYKVDESDLTGGEEPGTAKEEDEDGRPDWAKAYPDEEGRKGQAKLDTVLGAIRYHYEPLPVYLRNKVLAAMQSWHEDLRKQDKTQDDLNKRRWDAKRWGETKKEDRPGNADKPNPEVKDVS